MDSLVGSSVIDNITTVVLAVFASGGFWTWLDRKSSKRSNHTKLLLGLAHDRLIDTGQMYIARGWITYNEFEDYTKYLYEPYKRFGGNGLAEKVYKEVSELPIRSIKTHTDERRR